MEVRFGHLESTKEFTLATFLDPRYKYHFFRNESTQIYVKEALKKKLKKMTSNQEEEVNKENEKPVRSQSSAFQLAMDNIIKKNLTSDHVVEKAEITEVPPAI